MHLITMLTRRLTSIITNSQRQKVELNIGVLHIFIAANKASGLEVVGRCGARTTKEPLRTNPRLVPLIECGCHRDRLLTVMLYIHLEVVLHIFTHAG